MSSAENAKQLKISPDPERLSNWVGNFSQPAPDASNEQMLERSRQIIWAAFELLDESGLDGLTIRAVLKKTGLSRRAFYERFVGKDDLVLAVFEQTIHLATAHYTDALNNFADPLERLEMIVKHIVNGKSVSESMQRPYSNRRAAALSREHLRLAEARPHDLQIALQPLIGLIANQLREAVAMKLVRECDADQMAILVYNLVSTTVQTEILTRPEDESDVAHMEQLSLDVWDFCYRAIRP